MNRFYIEQQKRIAGSLYEGRIAKLLAQDGWDVSPRDKYNVDDRGIDITASKDGVDRYVQCKCLSTKHEMHENVIDQLYGSVVYQVGPDGLTDVEMYLYTSTRPTLYALEHARKLGVHVVVVPFPPRTRQADFIQ